jgi:hypothetical protein
MSGFGSSRLLFFHACLIVSSVNVQFHISMYFLMKCLHVFTYSCITTRSLHMHCGTLHKLITTLRLHSNVLAESLYFIIDPRVFYIFGCVVSGTLSLLSRVFLRLSNVLCILSVSVHHYLVLATVAHVVIASLLSSLLSMSLVSILSLLSLRSSSSSSLLPSPLHSSLPPFSFSLPLFLSSSPLLLLPLPLSLSSPLPSLSSPLWLLCPYSLLCHNSSQSFCGSCGQKKKGKMSTPAPHSLTPCCMLFVIIIIDGDGGGS